MQNHPGLVAKNVAYGPLKNFLLKGFVYSFFTTTELHIPHLPLLLWESKVLCKKKRKNERKKKNQHGVTGSGQAVQLTGWQVFLTHTCQAGGVLCLSHTVITVICNAEQVYVRFWSQTKHAAVKNSNWFKGTRSNYFRENDHHGKCIITASPDKPWNNRWKGDSMHETALSMWHIVIFFPNCIMCLEILEIQQAGSNRFHLQRCCVPQQSPLPK